MARGKRKAKRGEPLFGKGVLALFLGCAFLAAPLFLRGSPVLQPVIQGLKTPGWLAIAIGLVLLAAHHLVKRSKTAAATADAGEQRHVHPGSQDMFAPGIAPAPGLRPHQSTQSQAAGASAAFAAPGDKQLQWNKAVFGEIEWRRFEAVCERLFAQGGFETRSQSHGADGGVDIWLYSKHSDGPAAVVQCKHWIGKPVGVKEVREFLGVMTAKGVQRGTFATTSTFTAAAVEFAKKNGINLLDGDRLLALIFRRSEAQQQELLAVAYADDYWRPTCASCGVKMVGRTAAKDGSAFWGCANFPKCRTRLAVRNA